MEKLINYNDSLLNTIKFKNYKDKLYKDIILLTEKKLFIYLYIYMNVFILFYFILFILFITFYLFKFVSI